MKMKPDAIDLTKPFHRLMVLRAYHALLSQGSDEHAAKNMACSYALQHWNELQD